MKTDNGYALYSIPPKNMLVLCILEILKTYSDEKNTLSQKDIMYYLEKDFSIKVNRTSIKTNLMNLIDFGYSIKCKEIPKADTSIYTGWYYDPPLTDEEINIVFNCITAYDAISKEQGVSILEKLKCLLCSHSS